MAGNKNKGLGGTGGGGGGMTGRGQYSQLSQFQLMESLDILDDPAFVGGMGGVFQPGTPVDSSSSSVAGPSGKQLNRVSSHRERKQTQALQAEREAVQGLLQMSPKRANYRKNNHNNIQKEQNNDLPPNYSDIFPRGLKQHAEEARQRELRKSNGRGERPSLSELKKKAKKGGNKGKGGMQMMSETCPCGVYITGRFCANCGRAH